jgi:IclR family transcriptional regulator, pca regulon regulatory protein
MAAQLLEASVMRPLTPYTLLHAADILPRLPAIAERGYSVIDREFEVNMRTLSVPVVNAGDEVVGVVSMSVHAEKYSLDALISENLPRLFEAQALLRDLV